MMRQWYQTFMVDSTCPTCSGKRLNQFALAVLIDNKNIFDFTDMSIYHLIETLKNLNITEQQKEISRLIIKEILDRLNFLKNVHYQ
jgi:excinuclease ABC subunit A